MRLLPEWYPMETELAARLAPLRPAQVRSLTAWVCGTLLAASGCETAVTLALHEAYTATEDPVSENTIREALREWLREGPDKAAPCHTQVPLRACFAPLLAWLVDLLGDERLALAIDATHFQDQLIALVISLVYRGRAIPVAWQIRAAAQRGAWAPVLCELLDHLRPAVPADQVVLVLADEGLFSPRLFHHVGSLGWQPLLRGHQQTQLTLVHSGRTCSARSLIDAPGQAVVARALLFRTPGRQLAATVLVVWAEGEQEPWVLVTALAPRRVGVLWYGLRAWIECGFRDLKALGWQWERTQRRDPTRVERQWLVLAVATLWVLANGTRAEEAEQQGLPRALVHRPPTPPQPRTGQRLVGLFQRGVRMLQWQLIRGMLWTDLWLAAEAWPTPDQGWQITYHDPDTG